MFVFFFKQKTAYEMRISDWSSDVCSSDLHPTIRAPRCKRILPTRHEDHVQNDEQRPPGSQIEEARDIAFGNGHAVGGQQHQQEQDWEEREIGRASCRERECQYV